MRTWDVYQVASAQPHPDDDAYLENERFALAELPYVAVRRRRRQSKEAEGLVVSRVFADYPESRLALLIGIDRACQAGSDLILMALGVPWSTRYPNDPLVAELERCVAERDIQVVVAAGNFGPNPGTLSEFARIPGVVSVGATDLAGTLLKRSSRGTQGGLLPTVASIGEDMVVVVDGPSFEPGTSFASGPISRLCAMLRAMVWWMEKCLARGVSGSAPPGLPRRMVLTQLDTRTNPSGLPELGYEADISSQLADPAAKQQWLEQVDHALTKVELRYTLAWRPGGVLRLLQRLCVTPSSPDPTGYGAGFIDENVVRRALIALRPSVFFALFTDQPTMTSAHQFFLEDLDRQLGPLWDIADYQVWAQYYTTRLQYVAVSH